jgi:hypothetical protein
MTSELYSAQVQLLVRALPAIVEEPDFALKGGTAINLFVRDLPRLSVDIDLVYLPIQDRETSLAQVREGLGRIADRLRRQLNAEVDERSADRAKLVVRLDAVSVKIELSPVLRGTVFEPEMRPVSEAVEDRYGYAQMRLVAMPDLYAGKIAAALDRQHPRDLFDIRQLFLNEGITDDLFEAFLVYLVSHNRPPHELLAPHLLDLGPIYAGEFEGMTVEPVSLEELGQARTRLIGEIGVRMREERSSAFLRSFYSMAPDWSLLRLPDHIADLPAVRWKLINLERLAADQPAKFQGQLDALAVILAA